MVKCANKTPGSYIKKENHWFNKTNADEQMPFYSTINRKLNEKDQYIRLQAK